MPGGQNCSLNAHRKSSQNVLGLFDVKNTKRLFKLFWICSTGILSFDNLRSGIFFLKGEGKTVGIFFSLIPWPAVWSRNNRECGNFGIYSLREFVHKKSKVTFEYNRFLVPNLFRTNVKYSRYVSTTLSVGIRWTIWTSAGHLVVWLRPWPAGEFVHSKSTTIYSIAWLL